MEEGVRIVGVVDHWTDSNERFVPTSLEWNGTVYYSTSDGDGIFILDMDFNGNLWDIDTISAQSISFTGSNRFCYAPGILDVIQTHITLHT